MSVRLLRILAVVVGAVVVVVAAAGALMRTLGPASPQSFNIGTPLDFWLEATAAATYALVGVVLARRLPRHPIPWIFIGIALAFAGIIFTWAYGIVALSSQPQLGGAQVAALLNTAVLQPLGLALVVPLLYLFPDGHPVERRAGRLAALAPLAALVIGIGVVLTPGSIGIFTGLENPFSPGLPTIVGRGIAIVGVAATVMLAMVGSWTLLVRYRTATEKVREQIRWFLWAGSIATVVAGAVLLIFAVAPDMLQGPFEPVIVTLFVAAAVLIPIACAIAILRYRLYDIDRLISGTFVYGSLVAIVAGGYSAMMTALGRLSESMTGDSDLSVVLTTLILAVSFEPIKRRLETFAERFQDEPESEAASAAPLPAPDDAWVEAVAQRVAQILRDS